MPSKYSKKENWFRVRFSDEVHFDYEPEEQLHIIRQSDIVVREGCRVTGWSEEEDFR
jgi:hypothetical protein